MWPTLKFRLNGVGKSMRLVPLTLDYVLTEFNCGDEQLNNFLYDDAKPSLELRIANTFILEDNGRIRVRPSRITAELTLLSIASSIISIFFLLLS